MEKLLYNRAEVAKLIGLSLESVINLTRSGQLRSVKLGRSVRVHVEDLNEFARTGTANKTVSGTALNTMWQGKAQVA